MLCVITFLDTLNTAESHVGPLSNLSSKKKREIAGRLSTIARRKYDGNVGGASGMFLAAAHIEAQGLPGEDAAYALQLTTLFHNRALAAAHEAATGEKDVVDRLLDESKVSRIRVSREVAEATAGRALSDMEWGLYLSRWELYLAEQTVR